ETRPRREQPTLKPVEPPAPRPRSRWRRPFAAILIASAIAGVAWWMRPAPSPPRRPSTPSAIPVVADTAQKGDVDITLNGLGTVTSLATVNVRTQINGQLTDVPLKEGQLVKKGDLLAQIDPRPYEAALKQAQGQLTRDQGLLDQARMNFK